MRLITFSGSLSACLLASTVAVSAAPSPFDAKKFKPEDIITRDVAIVGGGAAGTYSAISLKDKGKSVIVIEKQGKLGGHTETYTDPATNTPVDIGVVIFHNITTVTDYFKRLDIPLTNSVFYSPSPVNYDLRTGEAVTLSLTPTEAEVSTAFEAYVAQLSKYPQMANGMFLPNPIPEDLLLPFGEFIKKYNLQAALPLMYNFNWGVGDILANPTVEQMRYWGLSMVGATLRGFLTTARHNTSELYAKAEAELSPNVLLNSEVARAKRSEGGAGIKLIVRTPKGQKLILAKKLLIAIPPKLDFVAPLDLSSNEKNLFGKYIDAGYYVSLVKNTGFPANTSVSNAAQNTTENLPPLPGVYSISPAGIPGVQTIYYGSEQSTKSFPLTDAAVQADIVKSLKTLQQRHPDKFSQEEPEFVSYKSHAPYFLQVSSKDIKNGFYEKLYALQGPRNTYWTGAAFRVQDSSQIWRYTQEEVLPKLLAGL